MNLAEFTLLRSNLALKKGITDSAVLYPLCFMMIKNGHSDAEFNPDARPGLEGQEYQVVCGDAVPSVALTRLRHSPVHGAGFFPVQAVPPPSLFKRRMNPISTTRCAPRGHPRWVLRKVAIFQRVVAFFSVCLFLSVFCFILCKLSETPFFCAFRIHLLPE